MGLYNKLEDDNYTNIVQVDTIVSWDSALKFTRHKMPIRTKALFYAKKDGKCFKVLVERYYLNRSSELSGSHITSAEEVTASEYDAAVAKIGPFHNHKRW